MSVEQAIKSIDLLIKEIENKPIEKHWLRCIQGLEHAKFCLTGDQE